DQPYEGMENQMDCDPVPESFTISSTHECRTILNGLKDRENNTFYFKCKDHPELTDSERNTNLESYKFVLRGTEELVIKTIEPNELLIEDARDPVPVTLKVETTAGFDKGASICSFSKTGEEGSYIQFFNTGSYLHTQELSLPQGDYTYYIQCVDLGGNAASGEISFSVAPDNAAPIVVRSYYEEKNLKIITNEDAECVYDTKDCTYPFETGLKFNSIDSRTHLIEWKPDLGTHYIKCKDRFGNQPAPNACSIVLRPIKIL
ncbi:MAG TPA: hypothetical protein PLK34_03050, partial [Candidatus Pacearchaeota archaeon]|nr:hypothetical protein [Candidatus Pacearchaeota archaeon]